MGPRSQVIPRHVKVQHIKRIANVLVESVSILRTGGLYHDLDFKDHQQEFSTSFEPLPPVEQVTYMPIEVNEIFIVPDIEKLTQKYDTLHDVTNCTDRGSQIILRKSITCRYPTFRRKFNVHTRIKSR